MSIRNRIVEHVQVRAGDLVPHPHNFREHPDDQRQSLADSYQEIGFARSLLGYRRPDGRIQLIDGHLRAAYDPDMEVTVELLDVTDQEADQLLLTIDPLAALAVTNTERVAALAQRVQTQSESLRGLWSRLQEQNGRAVTKLRQQAKPAPPVAGASDRYLIVIDCADESQQRDLLGRFQQEGLACKALIS